VISLTVLLDTSALLMVGKNEKDAERAGECFRLGREVIEELSRALHTSPYARKNSRMRPEDFSKLCEAVDLDGFPILAGKDAEEKFNQLRSEYEPQALAIAEKLMVNLPPWVA
jgi:hypothetical protein